MIEGEGLVKRYGGKAALDGVDVELQAGRITALLGPNGAGKTTLLRVLHLLVPADKGQVRWMGEPVGVADLAVRRSMAVVAQEPHAFRGAVRDNVALPLRLRGVPRPARRDRVDALLDRFELAELAHRSARKLSGGELQRLAFARALAPDPDVLFLDEFTANLDWDHLAGLEDALRRFAAGGGAAMVVAHDLPQIQRLADDALVLRQGRVVDRGPVGDVTDRLPAMWRDPPRWSRGRTPTAEGPPRERP